MGWEIFTAVFLEDLILLIQRLCKLAPNLTKDCNDLSMIAQIKTFLCLVILSCSYVGIASAASYSYDSLNRLTNVDYGNGSVISYTYDAAGNRLTYSGAVANDTIAPSIAITIPTTGSSYTNTSATINLSGTASDNVGVTLVTWQNLSGGVGVASGTNSWSINGIPLQSGQNAIFVTAYDAAGNIDRTTALQ